MTMSATRRAIKKGVKGYLFIAPFFIMFFIFTVIPIIMAIFQSFTQYNMLQDATFIGFENYKQLFLKDSLFLLSLKNTLIFAVIVGPLGFILSFVMAWVISSLKFKNMFALCFYAPSITSGIALSVIWMYFFSNDRYGLINNVLLRMGLITEPFLWLSDSKYILGVVIFISAWMSMGTGFLTFLAGIQSVSPELLEAARLDGVHGKLQEFWYIIIPVLKPQCLFAAINSIVAALAAFDIPVQVAGLPSPNYAAHTIMTHLYDYAFIRFDMGYASAIAVVLFVLTYLLGKIAFRLFASDD